MPKSKKTDKEKSSILSGLMFIVNFLYELFKELKDRKLTYEQIYDGLKSNVKEIADVIQRGMIITKTDLIAHFTSSSLGDNFKTWIVSCIPDIIPPFTGNLVLYDLPTTMSDTEIKKKQGNTKPFTLIEFLGIVWNLFREQSHGESGKFLNDGSWNIFHVDIGSSVVAVRVHWGGTRWYFDAGPFGRSRWYAGSRFFSRG